MKFNLEQFLCQVVPRLHLNRQVYMAVLSQIGQQTPIFIEIYSIELS